METNQQHMQNLVITDTAAFRDITSELKRPKIAEEIPDKEQ